MKNGVRLFSVAIAAAVGFAALGDDFVFDTENGKYTYVYPYYVVEVASGQVALQSVSAIKYVASSGAEATDIAYDDFLSATSGTFFKTGDGELLIDTGLTAWTGDFHVMNGVLHVNHNDGFGLSSGSNAAYAHNGATILTENPAGITKLDADNYACKRKLVFEGEGYNGMGGLQVQNTVGQSTWTLMKEPTLSGDGLLLLNNAEEVMQNWRPAGVLNLNGHTLTLRGDTSRTRPKFRLNASTVSAGSIIAENVTFNLQGSNQKFVGDATSVLQLKRDCDFVFTQNVTGNASCRTWTLQIDDCRMYSLGGDGSDYYGWEVGDYERNSWGGPVVLNADLPLYNSTYSKGFHVGCTFFGQVSGPGGFGLYKTEARRVSNLALHLVSPNNTFQGGVTLGDGGRLLLYANGALPADGGAATITNGLVYLGGAEAYQLPDLNIVGTGCVTQAGVSGGRWKTVTKTGEGTLVWDASVAADELVVAGGTIELPKFDESRLQAGLMVKTNVYSDAAFMAGTVYDTGVVSLSPAAAYGGTSWYRICGDDNPGNQNRIYSYCGYIRNAAPTNEVWRFAVVMDKGGRLYLDGALVIDQSVRNEAKTAICTVSPGWHEFEFRYFCKTGNAGATGIAYGEKVFHFIDEEEFRVGDRTNELGKYISPAPGVDGGQWIASFGLVVDRLGRSGDGSVIHNYQNYEKMVDPGDGSLFVTSTNRTDSLGWLPHFAKVRFAAGTGIDLGGWTDDTYEMPDLEGLPRVTGGNLRVTGVWKVPTSQIRADGKLSVDGRLVFGDDALIEIVEDAAKRVHGEAIVIAEATGGITMPTGWQLGPIEDETLRGQYELSLSPDGKQLLMKAISFGMILFVQ